MYSRNKQNKTYRVLLEIERMLYERITLQIWRMMIIGNFNKSDLNI